MYCISRRDKDRNLFVEGNGNKRLRWNLYSQIAIENDMLICAKEAEAYNLTDICYIEFGSKTQPCTLLGTNEFVDIGNGPFL